MKVNKDKTTGYHYMDEHNMIVNNTHNGGKGDSLGRTARGALIYDEDQAALTSGVLSCFGLYNTFSKKWYITRYPVGKEWAIIGCSRDHVVYALTALKLLELDTFVKMVVKDRAVRPAISIPYTIDQQVWFKALYSRFWSTIYALLMVPYLRATQGLKWVWRKFGGRGDTLLPTYAVFYSLFGVQAVAGKWAKRILRRAFLPHFEESNLAARMLCGVYVPKALVEAYVPTRKNRWTTRVDGESDRDLTLYPSDTPSDNEELGLLYYLYERQHHLDKK